MLQMSTNGFGQCGKRNKGARERVRKRGKRWSNMKRKGRGGKRKASGINYAVCLH